MTSEEIIARAMAARTTRGLRLEFSVPERPAEPYVCYPKDAAQKAAWLKSAAAKGWTLIS